MGIFKRASKIAESYVNDVKKSEIDEPSLIVKEMLVQAGEVKRLAGELEYTLQEIKEDEKRVSEEAEKAYEQAVEALEQGDEEKARDRLVKRNRYVSKAKSLQEQSAIYEGKLRDLQEALESLHEQIDDYKMERRDAEARLASASGRLALEKAKHALESSKAEALEALKQEARQKEALVDLHADIDEELAKLEASAQQSARTHEDHKEQ